MRCCRSLLKFCSALCVCMLIVSINSVTDFGWRVNHIKPLLLSCLQNLYFFILFRFCWAAVRHPLPPWLSPGCILYFVYRNERSLEKYKDVHIQFSPLRVTKSFDISGYEEEHVMSAVCVGGGRQALSVFVLIGISVSEREEATQRCNNDYAFSPELHNILIFRRYYYVQTVRF